MVALITAVDAFINVVLFNKINFGAIMFLLSDLIGSYSSKNEKLIKITFCTDSPHVPDPLAGVLLY